MKTIEQIRYDLREIKYYYSRRDAFDDNAVRVAPSKVLETVRQYNKYMADAPARLYDLYVALYTENCSQMCVAEDLMITPEYVSMQNQKILKYLQRRFNNEGKR